MRIRDIAWMWVRLCIVDLYRRLAPAKGELWPTPQLDYSEKR